MSFTNAKLVSPYPWKISFQIAPTGLCGYASRNFMCFLKLPKKEIWWVRDRTMIYCKTQNIRPLVKNFCFNRFWIRPVTILTIHSIWECLFAHSRWANKTCSTVLLISHFINTICLQYQRSLPSNIRWCNNMDLLQLFTSVNDHARFLFEMGLYRLQLPVNSARSGWLEKLIWRETVSKESKDMSRSNVPVWWTELVFILKSFLLANTSPVLLFGEIKILMHFRV